MNTYVDLIIHRTMLSNSNNNRLVVCGSVNAGHAVDTWLETAGNDSTENTTLRLLVQTFEESELGGVGRLSVSQGVELLNDDVRVSDDVAIVVHLLGRRIVVGRSVDEVAGVERVDLELHGKVLVGLDGVQVLGELELGVRDVVCTRDDAHRSGIARATFDLLAIGQRLIGTGGAEVDVVVLRGEGSYLTLGGCLLSVLFKALLKLRGIEAKGRLEIAVVVPVVPAVVPAVIAIIPAVVATVISSIVVAVVVTAVVSSIVVVIVVTIVAAIVGAIVVVILRPSQRLKDRKEIEQTYLAVVGIVTVVAIVVISGVLSTIV